MSAITNKIEIHFWSKEKDEFLIKNVPLQNKKYSVVAALFNKTFTPSRSSKQIRERYVNHLSPGLNKTPFSEDEKAFVLSQVEKMGQKWEEIASKMKGRTGNNVKNFYNAHKRKSAQAQASFPSPIEKKDKVDTPISSPHLMASAQNIVENVRAEEDDQEETIPQSQDKTSAKTEIVYQKTSTRTREVKKPKEYECIVWTPDKDQFLRENYKFHKNSRRIFLNLTNAFNAHFKTNVSSKRLRERYVNHIVEGILKTPFSQEDDAVILDQVKIIGTKWTKIAKLLPGRTADSIKNRFNGHLKKINLENITPEDQNKPLDRASSPDTLADPSHLEDFEGAPSSTNLIEERQEIIPRPISAPVLEALERPSTGVENDYKQLISGFDLEEIENFFSPHPYEPLYSSEVDNQAPSKAEIELPHSGEVSNPSIDEER